MLRTVFAIAVAGLIFAAVSGTAQAAPMAPLPAGITAGLTDLTDVVGVAVGVTARAACIVVAAGATAGAMYAAGDFNSKVLRISNEGVHLTRRCALLAPALV
jgi:hypothetical protein